MGGKVTIEAQVTENNHKKKTDVTIKGNNLELESGDPLPKIIKSNTKYKLKVVNMSGASNATTDSSSSGESSTDDASKNTNAESLGKSSKSISSQGLTKDDSDANSSDSSSSSGSSSTAATPLGSITATIKRYTLFTPVYLASDAVHQNTTALLGLPSHNISKNWSFDKTSKPDTPQPPKETVKAQFDIKKLDDEGNPVKGAKFDIYTADDGWAPIDNIGTLTTDKNGIATSAELDPGRYIAIEQSTGKNLEVDDTPVLINLTESYLKKNARVTKETKTDAGGKTTTYNLYHLTVNGPTNNHKPPLITSLLTNLEDNTQFAQPIAGPAVLNEHLYFSHLVGTESYQIHAWLVDKATGQPILINGQKIEATKTIGSPNEDNNDDGIEADADLQLKIPDASSLAGKDIVAYSEIARSDKPDHYTAVHQDINDKNETVHFSNPSIHTNAINKETGGKQLQPTDGEIIQDTVSYKELIPGKTYTLQGIVMDKETNTAVLNNGKKVEYSKTFTPTSANGEVTIDLKVDDHHYRDRHLVVFETLYYTDYKLCDHRDINDADQSLDVTNPQLHTTLSDNTKKDVAAKPLNTVEDVVRYTDLIPGQTYSVRGKLMDQVTDLPVVKDGVPVMATATFKPNMANGTVTLTFVFDGEQYKGHHITAFEDLYFNGRQLVGHEDLNDAGQTVSVSNSTNVVIPTPTPSPTPSPGPTPGGGTVVVNNNNNNNNSNSSNNNSGSNNNDGQSSNNTSNGSSNAGNSANNNVPANNGNNGSNIPNNASNDSNGPSTGNNGVAINGANGTNGTNNTTNQGATNQKPSSSNAANANNGSQASNNATAANTADNTGATDNHTSANTNKPAKSKNTAKKKSSSKTNRKHSSKTNNSLNSGTNKMNNGSANSVLNNQAVDADNSQIQDAGQLLLPTKAMTEKPAAKTTDGSETLPQTGNESDSKLQILGSLSIVFTIGSFVYFTRKEQTTGLN